MDSAKSKVDIIYADFSKAFDCVPHAELLFKLHSIGISGDLLAWFQCYLFGRSQYVSINNSHSMLLPVTSGVLQGSILGPLLFLVYINDLPHAVLHSETLLYADDTKFLIPIGSSTDRNNLQTDLVSTLAWSRLWNLAFNLRKFVHVSFSFTRHNQYTYFVSGSPITSSCSHRDLGVIISSDLSWCNHYKEVVSRSYRALTSSFRQICFCFHQATSLF